MSGATGSTETVNTVTVNDKTIDAENGEKEAADTEETVNGKTIDAESGKKEAANTIETANGTTVDTENGKKEAADIENMNGKIVDTESVKEETVPAETVMRESAGAETADGEIACTGWKKSDYYFDLPQELIAQDPLEDRSSSRLLVLEKESGGVSHHVFREITDYLEPGDCLVLNNTKVIPARLFGEREGTGAHVEVLLLKRCENDVWETMVKPGKKCRPGTRLVFGDGLLRAEVLETVEEGNRLIRFEYEGIFEEALDKMGEMPLPPYITHKLQDKNRYQTVYAKYEGSAAAPTAGLHFTEELLQQIKSKGVRIACVTLHVGLGTFRPVKEDNILEHHMHSEFYQVSQEAAGMINETKADGGRVVCVGTTSCRTIESAADENGRVSPGSGNTQIFIYPGYRFKVLDALITNFHLPESTLVMLVSALAGRENVLNAYSEAVRERYRFFSFGDAMLVI